MVHDAMKGLVKEVGSPDNGGNQGHEGREGKRRDIQIVLPNNAQHLPFNSSAEGVKTVGKVSSSPVVAV
jgi:hypothetical protein